MVIKILGIGALPRVIDAGALDIFAKQKMCLMKKGCFGLKAFHQQYYAAGRVVRCIFVSGTTRKL